MERLQVGEVTLFKQSYLDDATELEMFGVNNEEGSWVSLNDIARLLCLNKNKKKSMRKYTDENNVCKFVVQRINDSNQVHEIEEYFIRDTVVYDMIIAFRKERLLAEHFIFDVLSQLNGDLSYDPEAELLKEYINDAIDNDALLEFKIDESKMYYTLEYDENDKMSKKPCMDEDREVLYRKHKEKGMVTTCPDWLKEILK